MTKILFVCVENSCRSQMAEGFAKKWASSDIESWSAGSRPSGLVNTTAVTLMKEKGVDLSPFKSKGLSDLPSQSWDYVITMGCGDACPFVPSKAKRDWQIPDPKHMDPTGFRSVRDEIENKVRELIEEIHGASGKISR